MGGGNASPTGFNSREFEQRTSNSLAGSVAQGAVNAVFNSVASVSDSDAPSGEIPHTYSREGYDSSSFVDPGETDVVESGAPVVVDTGDGEVIGIASADAAGDEIDVAKPDGTVETVGVTGDGDTVSAVGDPAEMSDAELHQLARDKIAVSPNFVRMSDDQYSEVTRTTQNKVIDRIQSGEVAADIAESVKTVVGGFEGRSFCRTDGTGRADMGIASDAFSDTVVHEYGHAIASTYGFDDQQSFVQSNLPGKATPSQVRDNTRKDFPDFGGEYKFDDGAVEFDNFLLRDQNGHIPGQTTATVERAVAQASPSDMVSRDVSPSFDAQESTIESVSHSDVIEYEDTRGRTHIGMVTNKETELGDDGYTKVTVQNLYDSDGKPLSQPEVGNPALGEVASNPETREVAGEIHGVVDKKATAEARGVDTSEMSDTGATMKDGSKVPDDVTELVSSVNEHWAKAAAHKEAGRDALADKLAVSNGYSASSAHETMAAAVEASQSTVATKRQSAVMGGPELMKATSNVVEASHSIKEKLDDW